MTEEQKETGFAKLVDEIKDLPTESRAYVARLHGYWLTHHVVLAFVGGIFLGALVTGLISVLAHR